LLQRVGFSYDQYGNLTKAVISGRTGTAWNPGYSSTTNHYSIGSTDTSGFVTNDTNNTYSWDGYGKMAWSVTSGTPTCGTSGYCATYDAFGNIVETSNGSAWSERWLMQSGSAQMSGTSLGFAYFPAPAGGTAIVGGGGSKLYMHKDWLGSARLVSNVAAGSIYADKAYSPFGEEYGVFGNSDTEYNEFGGTTSNYYNGVLWDTPNRELSTIGRWLSPDPAGLGAVDPSNPQSWNRYAYVGNNPLTFTDPTGLFRSDNVDTEQENRDFANSGSYYLNGMEVSGAIAASLIQGTYVNFGSTPYIGSNTATNGQSYLYQLAATAQGSGYAYFGVSYGTAAYELGLPTDLSGGNNSGAANNGQQHTCQQQRILNAIPGAKLTGGERAQGGHEQFNISTTSDQLAAAGFAPYTTIFGTPNGYHNSSFLFQVHVNGQNGAQLSGSGSLLNVQAHIDVFNPAAGYGLGLALHGIWDLGVGSILFPHSSRLDPGC
jgi:RHS repeat-associated protein